MILMGSPDRIITNDLQIIDEALKSMSGSRQKHVINRSLTVNRFMIIKPISIRNMTLTVSRKELSNSIAGRVLRSPTPGLITPKSRRQGRVSSQRERSGIFLIFPMTLMEMGLLAAEIQSLQKFLTKTKTVALIQLRGQRPSELSLSTSLRTNLCGAMGGYLLTGFCRKEAK